MNKQYRVTNKNLLTYGMGELISRILSKYVYKEIERDKKGYVKRTFERDNIRITLTYRDLISNEGILTSNGGKQEIEHLEKVLTTNKFALEQIQKWQSQK